MGNAPSRGYGRSQKKKKSTKKKPDSWFETCTIPQLKELCKACKLPVSGTKVELCRRLLSNDFASGYGEHPVPYLKHYCKEKLLVQSGNKYDLILRLCTHEHGGEAKRAATETIVDDDGKQVEVLKKRKTTTVSPKMMYSRVEKKMNAVTGQKYQSHWGSKTHSGDVYSLMEKLIRENCFDSKIIDTDPMLALEMGLSVFRAFHDTWHVMNRPGYDTETFDSAVELFARILQANRDNLNPERSESIVSLLENVEACTSPYGFGDEVLKDAILVLNPDYDKSTPVKKSAKILDSDIRAIAALNGINPPSQL